MQRTFALVFVVAVLGATYVQAAPTQEEAQRLFDDFKSTYGRTYNGAEEVHRFACFRENLVLIEQRNIANKGSAHHGVNQFADLCPAEFAKFYLGYRPGNATRKQVPDIYTPEQIKTSMCPSVDWRQAGIVTPIKNQGVCGSCYTFSATGNMEGQWARNTGSLISLSEEELVQCSQDAGNNGCNGGLMDNAFVWVIRNGGIDDEATYPYTSGGGVTGACNTGLLNRGVARFASYVNLPQSEEQMALWVCEYGPLSIAVDASGWQTYTGGVVTNCPGTTLDHGVLIVGFDAEASPPFWIVKNSWGTSWGEAGYIRLAMGYDECGLALTPCSSVV
jgi:hypothetical protein